MNLNFIGPAYRPHSHPAHKTFVPCQSKPWLGPHVLINVQDVRVIEICVIALTGIVVPQFTVVAFGLLYQPSSRIIE